MAIFRPRSYLDFGDGSPPYYGTVDGVTHTYRSPGQYTLNYMAGTQCDLWRQGTHVLNIPAPVNYTPVIAACGPARPNAGFSGTPATGFAPLTVRFTSTSSGADAWAWKFGDGGTSPAENPSHTYITPGTYSVSLAARDSCTGAVNTADKLGFVTVTATAGTLAISSTPSGAIVFIDNIIKGITPVTLTDTAAGTHTLLLIRDRVRGLCPEFHDRTLNSRNYRCDTHQEHSRSDNPAVSIIWIDCCDIDPPGGDPDP